MGLERPAKRMTDVMLASIGLALLSPLLAVVAVALKLGSPGPVLYRGARVGHSGRLFHILKFRTMVVDAERLGGSATADDDPRLTRIGLFLRKYKLDELPQLLNVLKGDMSLVGPRPEVKRLVDTYSPEERRVLEVRPGITDWASIWDMDEGAVLRTQADAEAAYRAFILPAKIRLQLLYVERQSWAEDMRVLFHTGMRLFRRSWVPREIANMAPPKCHRI
ncbi:MAG: sugar transferase [Candidatus Solibacter sp.]|jgi:lipopolysaccharide/colanic/teichoic acid biosynthesis glycosyltransferase